MAPRTRGKEVAPKNAVQESPSDVGPEQTDSWAQLAQKHWLKATGKSTKPVKVKPDVVKNEIWDVLEKNDFNFRDLTELEGLQFLDR